jgi:hypothetical protein
MGSDTIIYIPSFIKTASAVQKLTGKIGRHTDTKTAWRSHEPTFIFLKTRKVG